MDAVAAVVADHVAPVDAAGRAADDEPRRDGAGDEAVLDDGRRGDVDVQRLDRAARELEREGTARLTVVIMIMIIVVIIVIIIGVVS